MRKAKEDMWWWGKNSLHSFDQESPLQDNPWWWCSGFWFVDISSGVYLYSGLSRSWKSSPMLEDAEKTTFMISPKKMITIEYFCFNHFHQEVLTKEAITVSWCCCNLTDCPEVKMKMEKVKGQIKIKWKWKTKTEKWKTFEGIRAHCARLQSVQGAFLSGRTQTPGGRLIWVWHQWYDPSSQCWTFHQRHDLRRRWKSTRMGGRHWEWHRGPPKVCLSLYLGGYLVIFDILGKVEAKRYILKVGYSVQK